MVQGISFDGLASGLNTEEIVEQLIALERQPVNRLEQRQQEAQVELELMQEVNTRLSGFENSIDFLRDRSSFESKSVNISDEAVLTATADRSAADLSYDIHVEQLARAHRVGGASSIENLFGIEDTTESLNLEGVFEISEELMNIEIEEGTENQISVSPDDSLVDIRNTIRNLEADVSATIMDGRLIITSTRTGEGNELMLNDVEGNVLEELAILDNEGNYLNEMVSAQDAVFQVDGMEVTRDFNTGIDDAIDGVTLNLHSTTGMEVGDAVTLEISQDVENTVETVKSFVESYNEIQNYLAQTLDEEAMMQGDVTLRRLRTNLREQVMSDINFDESEFTHLMQLGIEINRDGIMSLDEQQLQAAVESNPEDVQQLFMGREEDDGADGIARRMSDRLRTYLRFGDGIIPAQENNIQNRIDRFGRRIESLERRIQRREETIIKQFARMETALNEVQAQGSWLQGQLQNLMG